MHRIHTYITGTNQNTANNVSFMRGHSINVSRKSANYAAYMGINVRILMLILIRFDGVLHGITVKESVCVSNWMRQSIKNMKRTFVQCWTQWAIAIMLTNCLVFNFKPQNKVYSVHTLLRCVAVVAVAVTVIDCILHIGKAFTVHFNWPTKQNANWSRLFFDWFQHRCRSNYATQISFGRFAFSIWCFLVLVFASSIDLWLDG